MASRTQSFKAIVLKLKELPSGARVAVLLSKEHGILEGFIFGGGKSKLRSFASPWHCGTCWIYRDAAKDMIKLTDFDVENEFAALRTGLETIAIASYAAEYLITTGALGGDNEEAFDLMFGLLTKLENPPPNNDKEFFDRVVILFAVKALTIMGLMPLIDECASCTGTMCKSGLHYYSQRLSAFVCQDCAKEDCIEVFKGAIAWMKTCLAASFEQAVSIRLAADSSSGLKNVVFDMLNKQLGAPLKSLQCGILN
jgi:DNA repair protein RecO